MLGSLGRYDDAIICYRKSLAIKPNAPVTYNYLGIARANQGRLEEAVASFRKALVLKPDYAEVHNKLGNTLLGLGRLDEAVASFRRSLALRPDYAEAHGGLGLALLTQGDMAAGWTEYEWRWKTSQMIMVQRRFTQPRWRGHEAAGRTLLIHAEQGFGDTLQFCRYAELAAACGFRVVMEVDAPLVRLLRDLSGVDLVVACGEQLPNFDLHCPMLSMPLALGTTMATIPSGTAYINPDTAQVAEWRTRIGAMENQGLRIGLVWAGNPRRQSAALTVLDRRRSVAPDRLAPLFEVPGLHFFSLQKDGPPAPADFEMTDVMHEMDDFADTAALIANLDLVITVDTAVTHLAAAIGKPVWLLNRFDTCWRWMRERRDSPWYPTLRLYRQPRLGDWDAVLAEVAGDLRNVAAAGSVHAWRESAG